jgi:RND family efflux transporter MFP subunit
MKSKSLKSIMVVVLIGVSTVLCWTIYNRLQHEMKPEKRSKDVRSAPVEVGQIQRGLIELRRTFSGSLEAPNKFVVAPKVSGRVKSVHVDLADYVERGQTVAGLDDDEYLQAVVQAKADVAVARANLAEAKSALEIAAREMKRVETLLKRGVMSDSQFDAAKETQLTKQAQFEVAKAQLSRAEASLETANIRLGYTKVTADWTGGSEQRVVAERYVDEGETVSANTPLLSIVELHPITGVIFVTEKDYGRLRPGQSASLTTDAYPGERFLGRIDRIAPVFLQATRQARVELTIENAKERLKPGMFIRATVVLDRLADAFIVPEGALTKRGDRTGVFVVNEESQTVSWREVKVGIREGQRLQVEGDGLSGRVVTLGQQLVDDGSKITIPVKEDKAGSTTGKADDL